MGCLKYTSKNTEYQTKLSSKQKKIFSSSIIIADYSNPTSTNWHFNWKSFPVKYTRKSAEFVKSYRVSSSWSIFYQSSFALTWLIVFFATNTLYASIAIFLFLKNFIQCWNLFNFTATWFRNSRNKPGKAKGLPHISKNIEEKDPREIVSFEKGNFKTIPTVKASRYFASTLKKNIHKKNFHLFFSKRKHLYLLSAYCF